MRGFLRTRWGVGAMTPLAWVAVAALGGAMAIARFVVDSTVATRLDLDFPIGTLAVNLSGAVVLGILAGAALSGTAYTIVVGGGIGAYTTFSTWMLESHRAGEDGDDQAVSCSRSMRSWWKVWAMLCCAGAVASGAPATTRRRCATKATRPAGGSGNRIGARALALWA